MTEPTPAATRPVVRWIGPTDAREFTGCLARLRRDAASVAFDQPAPSADLTVLACPRPLVETATAAGLLEAAGAGSLVQLLGVWCEGEGRTGQVVPGVERVFWHAWPTWWSAWRDGHGGAAAGHQPLGLVRVDTPDAEIARALIAALEVENVAAVWERRSLATRPAVIVWDGAQLSGREASRLAAVCSEARDVGAAVVVLLDFPRPETVAAVHSIGAAAVVGKPFDRQALLATLVEAQHGVASAPACRTSGPVESDEPVWLDVDPLWDRSRELAA